MHIANNPLDGTSIPAMLVINTNNWGNRAININTAPARSHNILYFNINRFFLSKLIITAKYIIVQINVNNRTEKLIYKSPILIPFVLILLK